MNRIMRISFSLKNTYRVNTILYSLKQIPVIKKCLPERLYSVKSLKTIANIVSAIYEIMSIFLGKYLYIIIMIYGAAMLYNEVALNQLFLHIIIVLTIIGSFFNTHLFNPTMDKYYAMILMRMDAKRYTLVNYGYALFKVVIGFLPFTIYFGLNIGLSFELCLLLPFSIAGMKAIVAASSLWDYEKRGFTYNENAFHKFIWLFAVILLLAAYGLPIIGIMLPINISILLMIIFLFAGIISLIKIVRFEKYREINQALLYQLVEQMDSIKQITKQSNEKLISADTTIKSNRRGFEYLNELFIKRHQKILWRSTKRITYVCLALVLTILLLLNYIPEIKGEINQMIMNWLPYFVFIMYSINRGSGFTRALFMNCDHSLLTYPFYKQSKSVLKLFQIRLREITKINLPPAFIIGVGLASILYMSGGTNQPLHYFILIISIVCMSLFFSIHYLTIYYLFQPYNAGTEIKSGTYRMIMSITYLVCFFMINLKMPILLFGILTIVFTILYSMIACMMIYKLAPETFKLRN